MRYSPGDGGENRTACQLARGRPQRACDECPHRDERRRDDAGGENDVPRPFVPAERLGEREVRHRDGERDEKDLGCTHWRVLAHDALPVHARVASFGVGGVTTTARLSPSAAAQQTSSMQRRITSPFPGIDSSAVIIPWASRPVARAPSETCDGQSENLYIPGGWHRRPRSLLFERLDLEAPIVNRGGFR